MPATIADFVAIIASAVAIIISIRRAPFDFKALRTQADKTSSDAWKDLLRPTQDELERERTARKALEDRIAVLEDKVKILRTDSEQKDIYIGYLKGGIEVLVSQLKNHNIRPHFELTNIEDSTEIKINMMYRKENDEPASGDA